MSCKMGLTQRERLHLNLLQAADYKSLRYSEARENRRIGWLLFAAVVCWAVAMLWWPI